MFNFLSNRNLGDVNFGFEDNLYFFVKWKGKDYDNCKWENEYF